jgi:HSP20 family protein
MGSRNYREIDLLRQMEAEMARIADETLRGFLSDAPPPNRFWQPRVDVYETPESVIVKAEISGVKSENLSVELGSDDRILTISGERYEDEGDRSDRIRCYQLEISFGIFERQILLPTDVRIDRDGISANSRDGFLVVTLPKRSKAANEARTIQILE